MLVKVLVYNLSLTISLRVEYSRKLNLNSKDAVEFVLVIGHLRNTLHMSTYFHRLDLYVNDSVNQGT